MTNVILVNSHDREGRQRFTLAHGLGHLLFGDGETIFVDYRRAEGRNVSSGLRQSSSRAFLPNAGVIVEDAWPHGAHWGAQP